MILKGSHIKTVKILSPTSAQSKSPRTILPFLRVTNKFKLTTNAEEKLRKLKIAIKFILHNNGTNQKMYMKGYRIVDTLSQWIYSLSKQISLQRQQHGIKIIKEMPTIAHPFKFLDDHEVTI